MALLSLFKLLANSRGPLTAPTQTSPCQICGSAAEHLDTVDFNKACVEPGERIPAYSGTPIRYYLCGECGFCFAPEIHSWSFKEFEERIYNEDYLLVDPDYQTVRPNFNANLLNTLFGNSRHGIRHIDYGGGSGLLSKTLRDTGWTSETYDPFVTPELSVADLGQFDLVTAFEVFEHVPDVPALINDLNALCKPDGLVVFTTCLSDGHIAAGEPLTWWYAAPRNGHISLFSASSLSAALATGGFERASFYSDVLHVAYRNIPEWAKQLLKAAP